VLAVPRFYCPTAFGADLVRFGRLVFDPEVFVLEPGTPRVWAKVSLSEGICEVVIRPTNFWQVFTYG